MLLAAFSKLLRSPGGRFEAPARLLLQCVRSEAQLLCNSDAATVARLQQLLSTMRNSVMAAGSSESAQLIRSELLVSLMKSLLQDALSEPLSVPKAHLFAALLPCSAPALHKDSLPTAAAIARLLSTQVSGEVDLLPDNTDVILLQALHSSEVASIHEILQHVLSQGLSGYAATAGTAVMQPGHTIDSLVEEWGRLLQHTSPCFLSCGAQLLSILLQGYMSSGTPEQSPDVSCAAENAVEVFLLLCLAAVVQQEEASCAALLRSSVVLQLQHAEYFCKDQGLLYVLLATLRAASENSGSAVKAARCILPCATACSIAARVQGPPSSNNSASLLAFDKQIVPLIFNLAAPALLGFSQGRRDCQNLSEDELRMQSETATLWKRVQVALEASGSASAELCQAVAPELMKALVSHCIAAASQQTPAGRPSAGQASEGSQEALLEAMCLVAVRCASEAVQLLQIAAVGGQSTVSTVLDILFRAAFEAQQGADLQMRLLVSSVLLQLDDAGLFEAAAPLVDRHTVEMASIVLGDSMYPSCTFLNAILTCSWQVLPADAARSLLLAVLSNLWAVSFDEQARGQDSCSEAILDILDGLPAAAVSSVADFFTSVAVSAAEKLCVSDAPAAALMSQAVRGMAPHVRFDVARSATTASASRDEFAVTVLEWLCQRPPILSRDSPEDGSDASISVEASAMLAVASLYIDRPAKVHGGASVAGNAAHLVGMLSGAKACSITQGDDDLRAQTDAAAEYRSSLSTSGAHCVDRLGEDQHDDVEAVEAAKQSHTSDTHAVSCPVQHPAEPLAADHVQGCFSAAVAHQMRVVRGTSLPQGVKIQSIEHEALQELVLSACATSFPALASSRERIEYYLEAQVSAATVSMEQSCEAVCEALLDSVRAVAGLSDDAEPREYAELAVQLSWSQPGLVAAKLLPPVQEVAQARSSDSSVFQTAACELFCKLRSAASSTDEAPQARSAALERIESLFIRLVLCCGACLHVASTLWPVGDSISLEAWLPGSSLFWHIAGQGVLLHVHEDSISRATAEFAAWGEAELGVPVLHAAAGLLQCEEAGAPLHAAATRLALHPGVLHSVVKFCGDECVLGCSWLTVLLTMSPFLRACAMPRQRIHLWLKHVLSCIELNANGFRFKKETCSGKKLMRRKKQEQLQFCCLQASTLQ